MKKNTFMEGAMIATIAIIFSKLLGALYVIPFYRIIGEQGGALYGYAYNIYNIFLIISSAGIPLAISKLTSEYDTKKQTKKKTAMFTLAKHLILIFSLISFLVCFIGAEPIAKLILGNLEGGNTISDVVFAIRCVSVSLLIVPLLSISRGYLQGHKYISSASFSQVIEQVVRIVIVLLGSTIAVKVLDLPIKYAVGISVMAAAFGALAGYLYLIIKMHHVDKMSNKEYAKVTKNEKKEIFGKILGYSIPFIVVSIASSLYNTTDMILMMRTLNNIGGFSAEEIEMISSVFTVWGSKLVTIVTSIATGLTVSLIPSIVSAYVAKKNNDVNKFFNKALQVLLFIIAPITIFISIFSNEVWNVFYTTSSHGPIIFKYLILVAILDSAYLIICSTLQGLYKTKLVYASVILGLGINLVLDIPFMYLFNHIGIYPYYGAITATVVGYLISLGIPLIVLNKKEKIKYTDTFKKLPRLIGTILVFIAICLVYRKFMPTLGEGFIYNAIYLGLIGIISVSIYVLINYKLLKDLLFTKDK